jgi:hypothetical protein
MPSFSQLTAELAAAYNNFVTFSSDVFATATATPNGGGGYTMAPANGGTWTTDTSPLVGGGGAQEQINVSVPVEAIDGVTPDPYAIANGILQFSIPQADGIPKVIYGQVIGWNNWIVGFQAFDSYTSSEQNGGTGVLSVPDTSVPFFYMSDTALGAGAAPVDGTNVNTSNPLPVFLDPQFPIQPALLLNNAGGEFLGFSSAGGPSPTPAATLVGMTFSGNQVAAIGNLSISQDPGSLAINVAAGSFNSASGGQSVTVVAAYNDAQVVELQYSSGGAAVIVWGKLIGYTTTATGASPIPGDLLFQVYAGFDPATETLTHGAADASMPYVLLSSSSLAGGIPATSFGQTAEQVTNVNIAGNPTTPVGPLNLSPWTLNLHALFGVTAGGGMTLSSDQIAIASQSHSRTGYQTDADPGSVANPTSGTWTTSNDPLFGGNGTQESVRVAAVFDDWQVVQFQITLPNQTTATVYGKVVSWNNAEVAFQAYTTFTDGAGPSGPFTNMGFFVVSEVANAVDGKSAANNSSDTNPGNTDRGAFSPGNPYQPLFLSPSTPQPNLALNPAGGTSIVGTPISSDDVAFVGAVQQDPTTHTFSVIPSQNDYTVTDFSQVQGTAVNVVIDQVFTVNNTQVAEVTFTPSGGSAQVFDAQLLGYNADSLLLQVLTNFNSTNGTWYPDVSLNGANAGASTGEPFLVVSDASLASTNGIPVNDVFTTNGTLAPYGLTNITPICFGPGTLISTPSGEVEVERLGTGNMVLTQAGAARRVVWVGRGQVMVSRGRRSPATPVIVRKGALADNVPHQDLRVTKGHAFHIDGVLIPVEFLVNHRSIIWDDMAQEVTIYHVELETHDVLLANGAPAESYRDDGNRWLFQNVNDSWDQPEKAPFAPVLTGGPVVDQAWRRLLDRSGPRRGVPLTDDPDLHLVVDGKRIDAEAPDEMVRVFTLPAAFRWVRIVSRSAVPEELGVTRDPRALGVALRRLVVRQSTWFRRIDIADPALSSGFHAYEAEGRIRWTDGGAELPVSLLAGRAGRLELVLHLAATTQYIDTGKAIAKVA